MFTVSRALLFSSCALALSAPRAAPASTEKAFSAGTAGEGVAVITASCARCDWGVEGREAAGLRVSVDGKYSQHLLLARGAEPAGYRITLGPVAAGAHRITLEADRASSAAMAGRATVSSIDVRVIPAGREEFEAQSMAPFLYARPDTVGRFTDLPVFMWYEVVAAPQGRQFRYSVIFTNEDGGTATDRLMATWGRTTDIEFVYGATVNADGRIVAEEFQGPGHEVPPFHGRHEGAHPLQWVSTDNNMVSEAGPTVIRYAPAPARFDLTDVSREVVMDANPWLHALASKEMAREKKLRDDAPAGSGLIPDPRRFVFVEACTDLQNAAVGFSVHAADPAGQPRWFDADRGLPEFRIVRTGCFRGAVPLPAGSGAPDAVRFKAYTKPPSKPDEPVRSGAASVVLRRVNQVFTLGDDYLPRRSIFDWRGSSRLDIDGPWTDLRIPPR